jgi:hypothetical protein
MASSWACTCRMLTRPPAASGTALLCLTGVVRPRSLDLGGVPRAVRLPGDPTRLLGAAHLRADPNQLRSLKPPTDNGVDARLYHLWRLLNTLGSNRSRYAIDDLTPLVSMFGMPVVAALRDAFTAYWRHWSPTLRSERSEDNRNTISALDCIGIVGVTLEAAGRPTWAAELSHDDAVRAASYATLEINGFPDWLVSLAQAQPEAVREVLEREMTPELNDSGATSRCDALEDIARADVAISSLLANEIFNHLSRNEVLPAAVLAPILRILQAGYEDRAALAALLRARFDRTTILEEEAAYIEALLKLHPGQAAAALDAKLALLSAGKQTLLVQSILSRAIDRRWMISDDFIDGLPFDSLERLVVIAFGTIRIEDDNYRPPAKPTPQTRATMRSRPGGRCSGRSSTHPASPHSMRSIA